MKAEPQLHHVGCCNELNAGYAADGYARATGLGVLVVTHMVGALSALNAVAGLLPHPRHSIAPLCCPCMHPCYHARVNGFHHMPFMTDLKVPSLVKWLQTAIHDFCCWCCFGGSWCPELWTAPPQGLVRNRALWCASWALSTPTTLAGAHS